MSATVVARVPPSTVPLPCPVAVTPPGHLTTAATADTSTRRPGPTTGRCHQRTTPIATSHDLEPKSRSPYVPWPAGPESTGRGTTRAVPRRAHVPCACQGCRRGSKTARAATHPSGPFIVASDTSTGHQHPGPSSHTGPADQRAPRSWMRMATTHGAGVASAAMMQEVGREARRRRRAVWAFVSCWCLATKVTRQVAREAPPVVLVRGSRPTSPTECQPPKLRQIGVQPTRASPPARSG